MGAPIMVEIDSHDIDPLVIARKEIRSKKLPLVVRRYFPNNEFEDW